MPYTSDNFSLCGLPSVFSVQYIPPDRPVYRFRSRCIPLSPDKCVSTALSGRTFDIPDISDATAGLLLWPAVSNVYAF